MAALTIREEPVETQESELPGEATAEIPAAEPSREAERPREAEPLREAEPAEVEPLPKRKPGRPLGSKSKEPGKPRKPRAKKVVVQEEAVVEARPPQEELPRAIPGSFPIPEEAYDLRAAKMLRLLQIQGDQRKQQKRQMYSSWFR